MTDQELFELCQKYGQQARLWRNKFAALLPEVQRRNLHVQKGFSSIFEFAGRLAGMTQDQVRTVLRLDEHLQDKPALMAVFQSGSVNFQKLARVTSIATRENAQILAQQVQILPKKALETFVRDERIMTKLKNNLEFENLPEQKLELQPQLKLSEDVRQRLLELQEKEIDINALIVQMLNEREEKIAQKKEALSHEIQETKSRYIPAQIRKILTEEHGKKCSMKNCKKPAEEIHHTQRFSLAHSHDPKYLAPLCKEHHIIAHSIDVAFQQVRRTGFT